MIKVADARVGTCIINRGEPSKVTGKERVTVGTHMHSKTKLTVQGIFSGRSEVLTLGHHENLEDIAIVNKKAQVISKSPPNQVQLMDLVSFETLSATVTDEQFKQIEDNGVVTFIDVLGKIVIIEVREAKE